MEDNTLAARLQGKRPLVPFGNVDQELGVVPVDDKAIDRFYVDVGHRIRDARTAARTTQAQLAALARITRSSLANVEAGRQRIPLHVLASIAAALDVDPTDLFAAKVLMSGGGLDLSEELKNEEPETRDFIQGAIAQLSFDSRMERDDEP